MCDKENGCKYTVEVTYKGLRFTNTDSVVKEVALEPAEFEEVAAYVEGTEFRVAVDTYDTADWANVTGASSELEVVWEGLTPVLMSPVAMCTTCAEPEVHPIKLLSQKLWDLKLKYTGESL